MCENKKAGPEFEDPAHLGCHCFQRPLQTSRLPAKAILHNMFNETQEEIPNTLKI